MKSNLAPIVDILINDLRDDHELRESMSFVHFIREFRTIELNVARQVGKTTILTSKFSFGQSLLFAPNYFMRKEIEYKMGVRRSGMNYIYTSTDLDNYQRNIMHKFVGMNHKFKNILVDEPSHMNRGQRDGLFMLTEELHARRMLADDFYILMLGTA
jgi:hypothetical protein